METKRIELFQLKQKQVLPLKAKVILTNRRIKEWYEHYKGNVYVSFSGGKDSTVLLHLVRKLYPDVEAVFVDTGLEYPEIREFVKTINNVTVLRPKMAFKQVLDTYGYPVVSKMIATTLRKLRTSNLSEKYRNKLLNGDERGNTGKLSKKYKYLLNAPFKISEQCCDVMKKNPVKIYERKTKKKGFIGTMAEDSFNRQIEYLKQGCNNFSKEKSMPISFWTQKDVWDYIKKNKLEYSSIYNKGVEHTGCMFCMFGIQFDKTPNRFMCMKKTHPQLYNYCIKNLGIGNVLEFMQIDYGKQEQLCLQLNLKEAPSIPPNPKGIGYP